MSNVSLVVVSNTTCERCASVIPCWRGTRNGRSCLLMLWRNRGRLDGQRDPRALLRRDLASGPGKKRNFKMSVQWIWIASSVKTLVDRKEQDYIFLTDSYFQVNPTGHTCQPNARDNENQPATTSPWMTGDTQEANPNKGTVVSAGQTLSIGHRSQEDRRLVVTCCLIPGGGGGGGQGQVTYYWQGRPQDWKTNCAWTSFLSQFLSNQALSLSGTAKNQTHSWLLIPQQLLSYLSHSFTRPKHRCLANDIHGRHLALLTCTSEVDGSISRISLLCVPTRTFPWWKSKKGWNSKG